MPSHSNNTDAAVVICSGGALYALSISIVKANWLAKRGITAFVLKYRLVPTSMDATKELAEDYKVDARVVERAHKRLPFAAQDVVSASDYIRKNANKFGVADDKIGLLSFSAGDAVTLSALLQNQSLNVDFIALIYPWMSISSVASIS